MNEEPTKRRGPLLWLAARTWRFWFVSVALPSLYIAMLPPMSWVLYQDWFPEKTHRYAVLDAYFVPTRWFVSHSPDPIPNWIVTYGNILLPRSHGQIKMDVDWEGTSP